MPSLSDINPLTGKAYAIRPDGIWDDNFGVQAMQKVASGAGGGFNFDPEAEAKKAFGELGPYYNDLLTRSKGNLNTALARLIEDYNTGLRYQNENTTTQLAQNRKTQVANANARGLFQRSAFEPTPTEANAGYGIPTENLTTSEDLINKALSRYKENALTQRTRRETDLTTAEQQKEADLEEQKKEQAASIANSRGAYQAQLASASLF